MNDWLRRAPVADATGQMGNQPPSRVSPSQVGDGDVLLGSGLYFSIITQMENRRVFSFFDFRSSFSRFSDFIEASRVKVKHKRSADDGLRHTGKIGVGTFLHNGHNSKWHNRMGSEPDSVPFIPKWKP